LRLREFSRHRIVEIPTNEDTMKTIIFAAAVICAAGLSAHAQTTPSTDGETPAIATPDQKNPAAPVAGANSFTEDQARTRIEEAGYTNVADLKLDANGIWQASATKDSKPVTVSLDYQGNIVAQ
jgi:hypothetical protein